MEGEGEAHGRGLLMFATCNLWGTFVIFLPDTNFVVFFDNLFFWGRGVRGVAFVFSSVNLTNFAKNFYISLN